MRRIHCVVLLLVACAGQEPDERLDDEDGSFSGPKQDGFCAEPGSAEALGILALVNDPATTFEELDRPTSEGGAGLHRTAADNIIDERPFATLEELDAVSFVGPSACRALRDYACDVEGRCTACDPAAFPARPARTGYDSRCEALLVELLHSAPAQSERATVTDAAMRCDELDATQRTAFDVVARDFDTPPDTFSDFFGEFTVEVFQTTPRLAHVIEEDDFVPFHVLFDGDEVAAVWTTDGLSAGVTWFCGGQGEPAEQPEDFCIGALTDDAALCTPGATEAMAMTVAEARQTFGLAPAAVLAFAEVHGTADDEVVELEVAGCDDVAAFVDIGGETYHVVDSTRGLGITTLTRTTAAGTEILCHHPEF